ncbi:MAG: DUF5677 domain-containing protein [Phycisphaerae bacterium]
MGMPDTANEVRVFFNHALCLRRQWDAYQYLFMRPATLTHSEPKSNILLEHPTRDLFESVQLALVNDVIMSIARLTDPKQTGKKKNLTVGFLVDKVSESAKDIVNGPPTARQGKRVGVLQSQYAVLRTLVPKIRDFRNTVLAHLDLDTASGNMPLTILELQTIGSAVKSICQIAEGCWVIESNSLTLIHSGDVRTGATWCRKCLLYGSKNNRAILRANAILGACGDPGASSEKFTQGHHVRSHIRSATLRQTPASCPMQSRRKKGTDFMETPVTSFCHQAFDLLDRMREFADADVLHAICLLKKDNSRQNRRLDATVYEAYARMVMWMRSLAKLTQTSDVQAIGAGARCLFEQLLDLKWLEQNPGPEWLEMFHQFPRVDRYAKARKAVEYKEQHPASQINMEEFRKIMRAADQGEPIAEVVGRVWGSNLKTGGPNCPNHWTGEANILSQAERLGAKYADMYREKYPVLSWLVHSGSSAFHGRDFEEIESYVGAAYLYAFEFSHEGTRLACDILGITGHIPNFEAIMKQFLEWHADAINALPH